MRHRSLSAIAAALVVMLVSVPAGAQDATSRVSFDGLGFTFDQSLGRSVNITRAPAVPLTPAPDESEPAHVAFSLYGKQRESAKVPTAWDVPGVVRFYRLPAFSGYPFASEQLSTLQRLLRDRPDLATAATESSDGSGLLMPFMPVGGAGQAIIARPQYIDTDTLSGVAYVTVFRQDVYPFARDDFWYSFQGLSTNGKWYVAVDWVISASMFPKSVSLDDAERVGRSAKTFERYIRQSLTKLDGADPSAFTPSLTSLDALVRSITVADPATLPPSPAPSAAPSSEPSAAPSPAASVAPSIAPSVSPVASLAP